MARTQPKLPKKAAKKPVAKAAPKKAAKAKQKLAAKPKAAAKPKTVERKAPLEKDRVRQQAWKYYVEFGLEQKEIAQIVGRSEQTISKWKIEDDWESDRQDIQLAPQRIMRRVIKQYDALLSRIEEREAPDNVADSKEADILNKLADSVKKLQTEIGTGHKTEVGKQFVSYLITTYGKDKGVEILELFHEFIMQTS